MSIDQSLQSFTAMRLTNFRLWKTLGFLAASTAPPNSSKKQLMAADLSNLLRFSLDLQVPSVR